jgi:hypothetical protein
MEELIYGFNRFNGYSHIIPYIGISVYTCETGETCNLMILSRIKSKAIGREISKQTAHLFFNPSENRLIVGMPSDRLSLFNSTDFIKNTFPYFYFILYKNFKNERFKY